MSSLNPLFGQLFILPPQIEVERIIACLPLEFRGSDPVCQRPSVFFSSLTGSKQTLRRNMETVIEGLMAAASQGLKCMFFLSGWVLTSEHDMQYLTSLNLLI